MTEEFNQEEYNQEVKGMLREWEGKLEQSISSLRAGKEVNRDVASDLCENSRMVFSVMCIHRAYVGPLTKEYNDKIREMFFEALKYAQSVKDPNDEAFARNIQARIGVLDDTYWEGVLREKESEEMRRQWDEQYARRGFFSRLAERLRFTG